MKPAAQSQAVIELLDEFAESSFPADRIMARYFKQRRYIGSKDKAAVAELFYSVIRSQISLSAALKRQKLEISSRNCLALMLRWQGVNLDSHFNGEKYAPKKLPERERGILSEVEAKIVDTLSINERLNIPDWLWPLMTDSLGDKIESELQALNTQAPTDVRVNSLKSTREKITQELSQFEIANTHLSPWGLRFSKRVSLLGLDAFKRGDIEIQDEGSQLLALLTSVEPGMRVVDFCAGAGGKTLAMAAMMNNKGSIWATDVHSKRLEQLKKRQRRAGVHNVRVHQLSSEHDKWVKQHAKTADLVLIDAPCTGTGTWRRSPDARLRLKPSDLSELIELQASIMESASRLVKPGGILVYATCSLLRGENEDQICRFLERHPHFVSDTICLPEALLGKETHFELRGHEFRSFPAMSATDGFYMARLRRARGMD